MSDQTNSTATNDAAGVGAQLTQAIAAAVASAVTTSLNEITSKLNNVAQLVESRVKQTSENDDNNFETSVVGSYDPFDDLRRANMSRDRIAVYAERSLAIMLSAGEGLLSRSLDHFCATNPETAPRASKASVG